MLFELSRHSDHHLVASKKYQTLESHDGSPELPSGYIGMILLSFFHQLGFGLSILYWKKLIVQKSNNSITFALCLLLLKK